MDPGPDTGRRVGSAEATEYCHLLNVWTPEELTRILSVANVGPKRTVSILSARPFTSTTISELTEELVEKCAPIGPETANKVIIALGHQAAKRERRAARRERLQGGDA